MNDLQQWWQSLVLRERVIFSFLGLLVLVVLFNTMIWQPINQQRANAAIAVKKQSELLQWMQEQSSLAKQLTNSTGKVKLGRGKSITQRLNTAATRAKISINRFQSSGENSVQVWLENADAEKVFLWLETLQKSHGITVDSLAMNEANKSGFISIRMSLVSE